jgi:hypothetical protein
MYTATEINALLLMQAWSDKFSQGPWTSTLEPFLIWESAG